MLYLLLWLPLKDIVLNERWFLQIVNRHVLEVVELVAALEVLGQQANSAIVDELSIDGDEWDSVSCLLYDSNALAGDWNDAC